MRWIFGSTIGSIVTVIVITLLTIFADLKPALKDNLKEIFTHHWVGKGIIGLIVFVVITIAVSVMTKTATEKKIANALKILVSITFLATLLLIGFFVFEAYK